MKRIFYIFIAAALIFSSCEKQPANNNSNQGQEQGGQGGQGGQEGQGGQGGQTEPEINNTWVAAGNFAYDMMDSYYLWKKEIKADLTAWGNNVNVNPIDKVADIRYHTGSGDSRKDIDKWTQVTNDYESFVGDVSGVTTTYGYDFGLFWYDQSKRQLGAVVRYVYANSPAEAAGLKRGDVIISANNHKLMYDNNEYINVVYDDMLYSSSCTLKLDGGNEVTMTAIQMVENPVHIYKVLDNGEKKIGYLHYTSFTLESCPYLIEACKYFKSEGVKELILDLRYNGGGYVIAEELLISMLAPQANVAAGDLFAKEIYNAELTLQWGGSGESHFKTIHEWDEDGDDIPDHSYDTSDANIGLEKIYAIVTDGSASASEAIICCLKPFFGDNLKLIGEQTYGKYTAGYIIGADKYFQNIKDTYNDPAIQQQYNLSASDIKEATDYANDGLQYAHNWGIYVMYARYADRDGKTLSMPDGIPVDKKAMDNPQDGYQLGDPEETMLMIALKQAGFKVAATQSAPQQQAPERITAPKEIKFRRPEKPGMVKFPTSLPEQIHGRRLPLTSNGLYSPAE